MRDGLKWLPRVPYGLLASRALACGLALCVFGFGAMSRCRAILGFGYAELRFRLPWVLRGFTCFSDAKLGFQAA